MIRRSGAAGRPDHKNENTAEIKLATSTPGTCITGQLAVDTMFNVYIVSSAVFPCATLQ